MSIEKAIISLKLKYSKEPWYNKVGIPHDKNIIILYVNCCPSELNFLPASWEKIPLYIVKFDKNNCLDY